MPRTLRLSAPPPRLEVEGASRSAATIGSITAAATASSSVSSISSPSPRGCNSRPSAVESADFSRSRGSSPSPGLYWRKETTNWSVAQGSPCSQLAPFRSNNKRFRNQEAARPVLDAKALDADPEGAALLRSVLDTGLKRHSVQAKRFPKRQRGEERAEIIDGQTGSHAGRRL